jgi:hypothetical protein
MPKCLVYIFIFLIFSSCTQSRKNNNGELFTVLTEENTGIDFNNRLEETTYLNGFVYEYYYNGAGVAVADFNNDNLVDIYFVSNRRANNLYLNEDNLKFKNVTRTSNTSGTFGFPGGVTVVDINNDGLMDIYICKSGRIDDLKHLKNELLINQGINKDGIPVFKEMAKDYLLDLPYFSTQASFFDYDRDGDLDMLLINHGIDTYDANKLEELMNQPSIASGEKLFRNDNGKFIDVTSTAGIITSPIGFTLGSSIGDVNNDGWPDIYTGNDYSERDHLYLNNQDGTFTETSLKSFGHVSYFSMGTDMADINNDGLIDIMSLDMTANDNFSQKTSMGGMNVEKFNTHVDLGLHHQYMYNALQINRGVSSKEGIPLFSDVAQLTGLSSTDWSWSPLLFDMNNDGLKDVFISNGIKRNFRDKDFKNYHENKQNEAYEKGTLDKDAYMADLIDRMPTRKKENCFFLNRDNFTFNKIKLNQPKTSSNGAAYADFDNDGDIDIVVNNSDDLSFIYRNNSEGLNNFIKIELHGSDKNKNAIGARVEIKTKKGSQIAEHYFSRGFQSAMSNAIHFGLGKEEKIDTLIVKWSDGTLQYNYNVKANQNIAINYESSVELNTSNLKSKETLFNEITDTADFQFKHEENKYNDFNVESLIPHKMSQLGPGLVVADVNQDGLDDFFIGGAKGQSGAMFLQSNTRGFTKSNIELFEKDKTHEDTGAVFFDADNDGDQDLYIVSGGNEEIPDSPFYEDRFYENIGNGKFVKSRNAIPKITMSGLKVVAGDYDSDGDLDLFVGSRVKPMNYGQYSKSYILENQSVKGKIKFIDNTKNIAPELVNYTMVTDAIWIDYDKDSLLDLVITNEWGSIDFFKNQNNEFVNISTKLGIDKNKGWWYSLAADDIENDGDIDFIAGNLGLNYKYKASAEAPFYMYLNDFDQNDSEDIVLAYHEDSKVYPLRGRECSSNQMPFIKEKFKTYEAFGKADIKDVYGDKLKQSLHYEANNFTSGFFTNVDNEKFEFTPFGNEIQISSINKILIADFDGDTNKDLVLLGNLYASEVETPRNDASYGHFMKGNGKGDFKTIPAKDSGLYVRGDVKGAVILYLGPKESNNAVILVARNDDYLMLIDIKKK